MLTENLVRRIRVPWTSDASGDAVVSLDGVHNGVLMAVEFIPGSGVSNGYGATLTNDNGTDLLNGQGTGFSNTTNAYVVGGVTISDGTTTGVVPWPVSSTLTLTISGAGNATSGTVCIYLR